MSEDIIDCGFEILKMLCKREPYLARGLLYHKTGDSHCLACYQIPPDIDGQKVDPLILLHGANLEDLIFEFGKVFFESANKEKDSIVNGFPDKVHWRIVPYDNADLGEIEKLKVGMNVCNNGHLRMYSLVCDADCFILSSLYSRRQLYFFLRNRPLEQHLPEMQSNSEEASQESEVRDELKQLRELIISRYTI